MEESKTERVLDRLFAYLIPATLFMWGFVGLVAILFGWKPSIDAIANVAYIAIAETGVILINLTRQRRAGG